MRDLESYFDSADDEEEQIDGLLPEMAQCKETYYKKKFGFTSVDKLSVFSSYMNYLLFYRLLGMLLVNCQHVMWLLWNGYYVTITLVFPRGAGM